MLRLKKIALRIEVEILFVRNEQKDWNGKPDPQGNALIIKIKYKIALRIEVEILFVRNEQKDWNGKPDPQGNAQIIKRSKKGNAQIKTTKQNTPK